MNKLIKNYVFIFMGVSGVGKTVVANQIQKELNVAFVDGDFMHPRANILKMNSGNPLNDEDRKPWLESLNNVIFAMQRTNKLSLMVCSALKKDYRDVLRDNNKDVFFIYLKADFEVITDRLKKRSGHFMNPQLLKSQFDTLEEPINELNIINIDAKLELNKVVENVILEINKTIKSGE